MFCLLLALIMFWGRIPLLAALLIAFIMPIGTAFSILILIPVIGGSAVYIWLGLNLGLTVYMAVDA